MKTIAVSARAKTLNELLKKARRGAIVLESAALATVLLLNLGSSVSGADAAAPANIFFDTDMLTDCDDAGALAVLHALADRGDCEILATVVSVKDPSSAATVEAINI